MAEHVAEHVGASTHEFRKEVADLGERVKQADEQFDVQLQTEIRPRIGQPGAPASEPRERRRRRPPATPAAQIAALLSSPDGVRQAVVLNEILNRPTDRW